MSCSPLSTPVDNSLPRRGSRHEQRARLSQIAAAYYFLHFLVILPIVSATEKTDPLPFSITEAVLGSDDQARISDAAKSN